MSRTLKTGFFFSLAALSLLSFVACGSIGQDTIAESEVLGQTRQELDSAHTRVINECSQAMTGNWWTYTSSNWPTTTTYATYAYTSSDAGAWNLLLDNTYKCVQYSSDGKTCLNNVRGWWTSCKKTLADGPQYTPCNLAAETGYGDLDVPISNYTCQGSCASASYMRGGQCKPFMNLIAYRSGIWQGSGYAFKLLPTDGVIAGSMPLATYDTIVEGDFLRMPYDHALIVVRKVSNTQVVVLDSNWTGGNGAERVSSHVLGFSGSGRNNLGNYRVLKCIYTGACP
jgi:hypothetical protein